MPACASLRVYPSISLYTSLLFKKRGKTSHRQCMYSLLVPLIMLLSLEVIDKVPRHTGAALPSLHCTPTHHSCSLLLLPFSLSPSLSVVIFIPFILSGRLPSIHPGEPKHLRSRNKDGYPSLSFETWTSEMTRRRRPAGEGQDRERCLESLLLS